MFVSLKIFTVDLLLSVGETIHATSEVNERHCRRRTKRVARDLHMVLNYNEA